MTREADAIGGIDVHARSAATVVVLWGDVDATLRDQASEAMAKALAASAPVVCDAARLRFIDSTGIAFLLQLTMAAREAGLTPSLWDPQHLVLGLLEAVGMGEAIPLAVTAPEPT